MPGQRELVRGYGALRLDTATVVDPNGIRVGETWTASGWEVEISTGVARATPDVGLTYVWPAYDHVLGSRLQHLLADDCLSHWGRVRLAAGSFATSSLYIVGGVADAADLSGSYAYAGWDLTGGSPRARVECSGSSGTAAIIAAGVSTYDVEGSGMEREGTQFARAQAFTSAGTSGAGIQSTSSALSGELFFFLSFLPTGAYATTAPPAFFWASGHAERPA